MNISNYERLLYLNDGEKNFHVLPYGSILLKNINRAGDLLTFKSYPAFIRADTQLWVECKLHLFRDSGGNLYPVFGCDVCQSLRQIGSFSMNQDPSTLQPLKCLHSLMSERLVNRRGGWQRLWPLDTSAIGDQDECYTVKLNQHIRHVTLIDDGNETKHKRFLACVWRKTKMSVLCSVSSKSFFPYCQKCKRKGRKEKCFKLYQHLVRIEVNESNSEEEDIEPDFYWQRQRTEKDIPMHYNDPTATGRYGYNKTSFQYPIYRDPVLLDLFHRHRAHSLIIPDKIIPEYDKDLRCKHNSQFQEHDDNLLLVYDEITVYSLQSEIILKKNVYGRRTCGPCRCYVQADTHSLLLWNLGGGKFLQYDFLMNAIHYWASNLPLTGLVTARAKTFTNLQLQSTLTASDLDRAVMGFGHMMKFTPKDFTCSQCSGSEDIDTPPTIVADGKCFGPTSRKIRHLEELKPHPDDKTKLNQSTTFKQRTFLSKMRERKLLRYLNIVSIWKNIFCLSKIFSVCQKYFPSVKNISRLSKIFPVCQKYFPSIEKYFPSLKNISHHSKIFPVTQKYLPSLENIVCNSKIFPVSQKILSVTQKYCTFLLLLVTLVTSILMITYYEWILK